MTTLRARFARHADLALVLAVGGILLVLFVPIPKALLDLLVLANFGLAFLLLLLAFHVQRPVDLSTFPSLLLLATLFRLSLNVAATRLILSDGDAGRVIGAIGAHVVSGSYVVGIVVFSMMMLPPSTVALPLKILMFVLVDGWALLLKGLVGSFR